MFFKNDKIIFHKIKFKEINMRKNTFFKFLKFIITCYMIIFSKLVFSDSVEILNVIPLETKLNINLLDKLWNNREHKTNQEIIASYLMTEPNVPNDFEIAWRTARLVYFIGNFGIGIEKFVDSRDGVKLFKYGYKAGEIAKTLKPNRVEGYYWYAVDLGSYGLAKGIITAASNAKSGMKALENALAINPDYQGYGSSRILGRYYQELPRIFGGNKEKALFYMKNAVDNSPKYKDNWLFLGRFYLFIEKDYLKAKKTCEMVLKQPALSGKFEDMRYDKEANECISKAEEKLK